MPNDLFFGGNTFVAHQGHLVSQRTIELSDELERRYPNLALTWIPPNQRGPEDAGREFAIVDTYDNDMIIFRFSEDQAHISYVMKWLWDNDADRAGNSVNERLAALAAEGEKARKDKIEEEALIEADFFTTMVKSGKNDFKHNGVKLSDHPSELGKMLHGDRGED